MKTLLFAIQASVLLFGSSCLKDEPLDPYDYNVGYYPNYNDTAESTYNVDSLYFLLDNGNYTSWASNHGDSINFRHHIDYLNNYMHATTKKYDPLFPIFANFKVYPNGDNSLKFERLDGGDSVIISCEVKNEVLVLDGIEFRKY